MTQFIMMVGIPGSGKSTVTSNMSVERNAEVFSSDRYRLRLLGDEGSQENNALVFDTLYADMITSLKSGKNCILDATNLTVKTRHMALERVKDLADEYIAVVVNTPLDVCINRDSNRARVVGSKVINRMACQFEFPMPFEGFTDICVTNPISETAVSFDDIMKTMNEFNQNNHHHLYSLGEHTRRVMVSFPEDSVLYEASKFHDVGKLYTQTTDENGESHYYSHANISAYWVMCNLSLLNPKFDFKEILFYINYHMKIRDVECCGNASTKEKYKKMFGNDRYNALVEFMYADNKASGTEN